MLLMTLPASAFARDLELSGLGSCRGEAWETILLTGSGFDEHTRVTFGPMEATFVTVVAPDRIAVVVPPGNGTVDVCVSNGIETALAPAAWRYGAESLLHPDTGWVLTCGHLVVDAVIVAEPVPDADATSVASGHSPIRSDR